MAQYNEKERWNTMARQFDELQVPRWGHDPFLRLLEQLPIWNGTASAFDLGCGAGGYAIALSPRCKEVIGSDISDEMIACANRKKDDFAAGNTTFFCEDWAEVDPAKSGYEKRFDLIIGHMTPALCDMDALQKMNQCSKGYCAMTTFQKREAPLQNELLAHFGQTETASKKSRIPEFFTYLYELGMNPEVTYYKRDDTRILSPEEAIDFYKRQLTLSGIDVKAAEDEIRRFVTEHTASGVVTNPVHANIAAMIWHTNHD